MSQAMIYLGFAIAFVVWLWTSFLAWANWGLVPALVAFFFPPADLLLMFMLGTWPAGLLAVALVGIGNAIGGREPQ